MDWATLHPCCFWTFFLMELGRLLSFQSNGRRKGSGWRRELPCCFLARGGVGESRGGNSAYLPLQSHFRNVCNWKSHSVPCSTPTLGMSCWHGASVYFLCADSLVTWSLLCLYVLGIKQRGECWRGIEFRGHGSPSSSWARDWTAHVYKCRSAVDAACNEHYGFEQATRAMFCSMLWKCSCDYC